MRYRPRALGLRAGAGGGFGVEMRVITALWFWANWWIVSGVVTVCDIYSRFLMFVLMPYILLFRLAVRVWKSALIVSLLAVFTILVMLLGADYISE